MAIYAIGDLQGCYDPFRKLLDKLEFNPDKDTIWLTGDLVNRGPKSLKTIRFVKSLGDSAITVLGNHDLHLLALANDVKFSKDRYQSLWKILGADDGEELLDWLRALPLAHYSKKLNTLMVHAGIPPQWTIKKHVNGACRYPAAVDDQENVAKGSRGRNSATPGRLSQVPRAHVR